VAPPEPERTVETSRVRTRMFTYDDVDALAELYSDPRVNAHLPYGADPPEEARNTIVGARMTWRMYGYGPWAVESKETGELVGQAGLSPFEDSEDVHYNCILASSVQGKSVATELIKQVYIFAFRTVQLPRFFTYTRIENVQAQTAIVAAGMVPTADRMAEGLVQRWFVLERERWETLPPPPKL
jgi:RimJ/RimL family protein N-acetyltransferase